MRTRIPWCEETWNVFEGCTPCSPGCARCYAARFVNRFAGVKGHSCNGLVKIGSNPPQFNGEVRRIEKRLKEPIGKSGRVYFVNSRSDTFHPSVPTQWIIDLFDVMEACPQHTFLVLTKRPERVESVLYGEEGGFYLGHGDYLSNVWLGITAENQAKLDERGPLLFDAGPGWKYFLSAEPMLGAIEHLNHDWSWVISGGESGADPRPMHPRWPRSLRAACQRANNIPFLFKQWGGYCPTDNPGKESIGVYESGRVTEPGAIDITTGERAVTMCRFKAGTEKDRLDGEKVWGMPNFQVNGGNLCGGKAA